MDPRLWNFLSHPLSSGALFGQITRIGRAKACLQPSSGFAPGFLDSWLLLTSMARLTHAVLLLISLTALAVVQVSTCNQQYFPEGIKLRE
jgi:hypothetical protein